MTETWNELLGVYDACDEGIAALEAVIGDLDEPMPCDWAWALAVLSAPGLPTREYVGWAIGRVVGPWDVGVVAGADLRSADLRGADMRHADLRDAYLPGASLRRADLQDANLAGASLREADLRGANLDGADLRGADLTGADITGADLDVARRAPSDPAIPGWIVVNGRLVCDFS